MLRQQIREAAAQMVRMQRLWEIELSVARNAPIAEFAQRVRKMNTLAQKKITTALARAAAERERLAAAERERLANQGDDAQAEIRRAIKEYEAEQQRMKKELQERQNRVDVLKNQIKLLTAEIEQAHVTARENLHFHLGELEKQLVAKAAIDLEAALQSLRKEMQIKAAVELDALRAALVAQHEEEMGLQRVQMEMQMQSLRVELKEQARLEREAAVQEVIDHFKQSRVMSLEEQRTSLNATFEREMATMERKLSNQSTELSTLRRTVIAHREGVVSFILFFFFFFFFFFFCRCRCFSVHLPVICKFVVLFSILYARMCQSRAQLCVETAMQLCSTFLLHADRSSVTFDDVIVSGKRTLNSRK